MAAVVCNTISCMQDLDFAYSVYESVCNLVKSLILPEVSSENCFSWPWTNQMTARLFSLCFPETLESHMMLLSVKHLKSCHPWNSWRQVWGLCYKSTLSNLPGLLQSNWLLIWKVSLSKRLEFISLFSSLDGSLKTKQLLIRIFWSLVSRQLHIQSGFLWFCGGNTIF